MLCELCGKSEASFQAIIEGSSFIVCKACQKFGKVVGNFKPVIVSDKKSFVKSKIQELPSEEIVQDYASKIRNTREKLGKNQEEFAKFINEKVSIIHKLETGSFEPSIDLARKLERLLKIKLVETVDSSVIEVQKENKSEGFTIGDFIKVKAKKCLKN